MNLTICLYDRVHANKISKYEIFSDGIAIKPENILVINAEIMVLTHHIESVIFSKY